MKNVSKRDRNIELDFLRGVACLLVMLFHYTYRFFEISNQNNDWPVQVSFGYMGVSVFFMLSGYFSIKNTKETNSLRLFFFKKCVRLFPAYWVALILTGIITYIFLPERAVSWIDFAINFTMLESFFGVAPVDGVYWTLQYELLFYVFTALIIIVFKKKKYIPHITLIWLLVLIGRDFINIKIVGIVIDKLMISQYGPIFVLGYLVYYLLETKMKRWEKILVYFEILLSFYYLWKHLGLEYLLFIIFVFAFLLIIVNGSIKEQHGNRIVNKIMHPFSLLAGISYPLYLVHQNIGYAILKTVGCDQIFGEFVLVIPITVSILLAYIINKWIEKPIAVLFNKKFQKGGNTK